jgi:hypothetical protein
MVREKKERKRERKKKKLGVTINQIWNISCDRPNQKNLFSQSGFSSQI